MKKSKLKTRLKCSNSLLKNCGEQNNVLADINMALRRELADLRIGANGAIERNVALQKELTELRGHYATIPAEWVDLVQKVAATGYHTMPVGTRPCSCTYCTLVRKARNLLIQFGKQPS